MYIPIIILYLSVVLFYLSTMVYLLFINKKIVVKYVKVLLNRIENTFDCVLIDDENFVNHAEKFIDYSYNYLCEIMIKIQELIEYIYIILNRSYKLIDFINNLVVNFHDYFHLGLFMICFKVFLNILLLYYLITNRPSSK